MDIDTHWRRIALIGFSGTGKTSTARQLSAALGWQVVDLDEELERHFGMIIPDVFASRGESEFRLAERKALVAGCSRDAVVIATGGGAAANADAWSESLLGDPETLTVTLDAAPETSLQRLQQQHETEGEAVQRPMIAGEAPLERITSLKSSRQEAYDRSLITLIVDKASPEFVAAEIVALVDGGAARQSPSVILRAPGGQSDIFVRPGLMHSAGEHVVRAFPEARSAWIITDRNVQPLHAPALEESLRAADLAVTVLAVPSGEGSKSLAAAGELYDQLLGQGIERTDLVVALGGGVIGDLAGFVAATVLRGVGLVQIPTSMLAMVDSSVGGKTGINHRAGKNLIGSFYQPPLVLIDPETLRTLPARELRQGWAEIVKHAVIQPSTPGGERADLLRFLERNAGRLLDLSEPATSYLIARNVALKSSVVEADERESGIRAFLNFGHTAGHAIEASDYKQLHGEAVALGTRVAARLSATLNEVPSGDVDMLDSLLDRFGLPATATFNPDTVLSLMKSDKKRVHGMQRWVLMHPDGGVVIRNDVPEDAVRQALESIREGAL